MSLTIGKRYNKLVALERSNRKDNSGAYLWTLKCDCGNITNVTASKVRLGHTKSCGCLQKELARQRLQKAKGQSGLTYFYREYERSAKTRGLEFSLTKEEFIELTQKDCHYCNKLPIFPRRRLAGYTPEGVLHSTYYGNGIDRVDNVVGYTKENCVPCCPDCNSMKGALSLEVFIDKCRIIATKYEIDRKFNGY